MGIKTYKSLKEFEKKPAKAGEVYIYYNKGDTELCWWVEIAFDRNVGGFFKEEDARDYAEYLKNKK